MSMQRKISIYCIVYRHPGVFIYMSILPVGTSKLDVRGIFYIKFDDEFLEKSTHVEISTSLNTVGILEILRKVQ